MAIWKKRVRLDPHWWQEPQDKAHGKIFEVVKRLQRVLNRDEPLKRQLQLLHNRNYGGLAPGQANYNRHSLEKENKLIINTMANLHQTIKARVCISRPRPQFLSDGGNWQLRRRARKLDKFTLGEFHRNRTYEKAEQCFDDAMWADTGFFKVHHDGKSVLHERVFPGEILVDEQGALTSPPRTIYQVRAVSADVLYARYPKAKEEIKKSTNGALGSYGDKSTVVATDLVWVAESYHLPSEPGADDGRLCVVVEEGTLEDTDWPEDCFPYAAVRWQPMPIGYYGMSFVEQQAPIQRETNELFRRFQEAFNINNARVFAEEGSLNKDHLSNDPAVVNWVSRTAKRWPTVHIAGSVPSDAYNHAWRLVGTQHQTAGTSEMSASGTKPGGDLSGIALRTLQDVETQRHGMAVRSYERFLMEIAELTVKAARRIYKHNPKYQTSYVGKRFIESIKWSDVDVDHYVLQLWPTNLLPATPTGKLATVQDLLAAGLVQPDTARMLLDFPDIEGINFEAAELEYVDFIAEKMLDGEKWPPQDYQSNLAIAIRRIGRRIMLARMDGATAEDVQPLTDWIGKAIGEAELRKARMQIFVAQAQAEMAPKQAPGAAGIGAPPAGGPEMGPPGSPPPSGPAAGPPPAMELVQ